ncbi:hypothetical protein H4Q26_004170 [Puccinia striiformis f. sp. tritici PST-130]|nr:hypothetical protein H4Q26_004170 [Puccinia striiformis f. sp. tritici PST-130]
MRHHIVKLSTALSPNDLRKEPGSALKLISSIQSDLVQTFDQIRSVVCNISIDSNPNASPIESVGQHLHFRLHDLEPRYTRDVLRDLHKLWYGFHELIRSMEITTKKYAATDINGAAISRWTMKHATSCLERIDWMIECLAGSDFDMVQYDWPRKMHGMDGMLSQLLDLINPPTMMSEGNLPLPAEQPHSEHLINLRIELAKSVITIIKLSKLFFNKLSKRGLNMKRLPLNLGMSFDELADLSRSAEYIARGFGYIVECLRDGAEVLRIVFIEAIRLLGRRFKKYMSIILLHVVPLVPKTDSFPVQDYFRTWFATWYDQLTLAIQNYEFAVNLLCNNVL